MKKAVYISALTVVTSLLVLQAEDASLKAKVGDSELKVKAEGDYDRDARENLTRREGSGSGDNYLSADQKAVKHSNKASGLLGMEVRNQNNEKLGEIKDLVVDLNTGKINYAVLAVGGFLGIGEKLIAVPSGAFSTSEDHSYLLLNADKAKVQAAVGFPTTNWPDPNDQKISGYWLTPGPAQGAAPRSETDRASRPSQNSLDVDRDRNADRRLEVNVDDDKNEKLYTESRSKQDRQSVRAKADLDVDKGEDDLTIEARARKDANRSQANAFEGEIKSVDVKNGSLAVRTENGETRVLYVDEATTMRQGRAQVVRLTDYKPGYNVRVEYETRDGKLVARTITRTSGGVE